MSEIYQKIIMIYSISFPSRYRKWGKIREKNRILGNPAEENCNTIFKRFVKFFFNLRINVRMEIGL